MPGESGFDLLDKIEAKFKVIFVTAFDEYAIRAFEVSALDYLLKPVEPERLTNAIKRLFEPAAWEKRLPDRYFSRIHRSTIINLEYVDRVEEWFNYSYRVYLRDIKEPFVMSRRYAAKLKEKLK